MVKNQKTLKIHQKIPDIILALFQKIPGSKLNAQDLRVLTTILNDSWKTNITPETMKQRLNSGSLFIIAKDLATDKDLKYLKQRLAPPINSPTIPVGIIETIDSKTGGNYNKVPKNYSALTKKGLWKPQTSKSDTLILVDATILSTRKGKNLGRKMMAYTLKNITKPHKYLWTYTPNIEKVKRWHESLGAKNTNHIIKQARPEFIYSDVNIMSYPVQQRNLYKDTKISH